MTTPHCSAIPCDTTTEYAVEDRPIVVRARRVLTDAIARNTLRDRLDGASNAELSIVARAGSDVDSRAIAHSLLRERCAARLGRLTRAEAAEVHHQLVMKRTSIRGPRGQYLPPTNTVDEDMLAIMGGAS